MLIDLSAARAARSRACNQTIHETDKRRADLQRAAHLINTARQLVGGTTADKISQSLARRGR